MKLASYNNIFKLVALILVIVSPLTNDKFIIKSLFWKIEVWLWYFKLKS
jgi:hypothetical protein